METLIPLGFLLLCVILLLRLFTGVSKRKRTSRAHWPDLTPDEPEKKYYQGYYKPKFPKKYRGDSDDIVFRSSWERVVFEWCDFNPYVVAWASEELAIKYYMKGVPHPRNYYPDILIHFERGDTMMVEIKPNEQKEVPNYENRCKWAAARAYCREKGWQFRVWDEKTIEKMREKVRYWKGKSRE